MKRGSTPANPVTLAALTPSATLRLVFGSRSALCGSKHGIPRRLDEEHSSKGPRARLFKTEHRTRKPHRLGRGYESENPTHGGGNQGRVDPAALLTRERPVRPATRQGTVAT